MKKKKKRVNGLFGYVKPLKEELKIREYNTFRAYYCGLCKELGKQFNQLTRMGLNYDFTFLSLLLSSLNHDRDISKPERCIANPVKKKAVIQPNQFIEYSAHMSIILVYFKLLDDWKDDKKLTALFALIAYLNPIKKTKKHYAEKYTQIKQYLEKLDALEKKQCDIIDESADAFGKLMEQIFVYPEFDNENMLRPLAWLGYNLGRWIYIVDAFHDIERDIKQKQYNPVLLQYKYTENEEIQSFINRVREPLEISLTYTLDNVAKSYELLDIKNNKGLLDNIIYMGLRNRMELLYEEGVKKT